MFIHFISSNIMNRLSGFQDKNQSLHKEIQLIVSFYMHVICFKCQIRSFLCSRYLLKTRIELQPDLSPGLLTLLLNATFVVIFSFITFSSLPPLQMKQF